MSAETIVHPTAVIDEDVVLGKECRIWHFVHVSAKAELGDRVVLGQNVFVGNGVKIGSGCRIQNNVAVYEGVELDDDVFLGPSCVFTNVTKPRAFISQNKEYSHTRVHRGVTIGANATIVCGNSIGEFAFIGAGAVVIDDVQSYALVVGNPARQIGWVCRCGERLGDLPTPVCHACGSSYSINESSCRPTPLSVPDNLAPK